MGGITLHVAQTVNTEQLQHYIPQKHTLFQYIVVNILHKGDNKVDDKFYSHSYTIRRSL